jgi:hypothetical protein
MSRANSNGQPVRHPPPQQQAAQQPQLPQWQHPADPGAGNGHAQAQAYYFPPAPGQAAYPPPPHGQQPSLSAYVPAAAPQPQTQPPGWPPADPRLQQQQLQQQQQQQYDFAAYGTHTAPGQAAAYGQPQVHPGYLPAQIPVDAYGQPQPALDPAQGYGHDPRGQLQPFGHPQGNDPAFAAEPEGAEQFDDDYEEEEEPRRGRRTLMVVACLVGAIGVGGGLAYGYKTFSGGFGGAKPVLRAERQPPKTKPVAIVADKKAEKLNEPVAQVASASSEAGGLGGPRPVQTITISPSGGVGSPTPAPVARPTVSVPGVTLDNSMAPPPRALPPVVAPQAPATPPQQQVAALPPPKVLAPKPPAAAAQATPPAATPPVKRAPVQPKQKAADAYSPSATPVTAAPAAPTGGNGFVAVLSSQKSRMDALKVYADLQQKYGEVLSNKPADVMERDLGQEKGGLWYRAVVGPPGSREAASSVCAQLKAAGFTGCWVTAY